MALEISSLEGYCRSMALWIRALRSFFLVWFSKIFSVILFFKNEDTCDNARSWVMLSFIANTVKGMSGKLRTKSKLVVLLLLFLLPLERLMACDLQLEGQSSSSLLFFLIVNDCFYLTGSIFIRLRDMTSWPLYLTWVDPTNSYRRSPRPGQTCYKQKCIVHILVRLEVNTE